METHNAYFKPRKKVIYERFQFNQASQAPNETVGQYAVHLSDLGLTCDYDNVIIIMIILTNKFVATLSRHVLTKNSD